MGFFGEQFDTPFMRAGGAEHLNSKAFFRLLAAAEGWLVPQGGACRTVQDFVETVEGLFEISERVIAKANMGVGGLSNLVLCANSADHLREHAGAPAVLHVSSRESLVSVAESFGLVAKNASAGEVFVEEYIEDTTPVFTEYFISNDTDQAPVCMMAGPIENDPIRGVLSGVTTVPLSRQRLIRQFLEISALVAARLKATGYRGLVNIDGIIAEDNKCYLNEVNARMGGGTHIDVIAQSLIGSNWNTDYTASTRFGRSKLSFTEMRARLEATGVAWPCGLQSAKEGVVVVSIGGPSSPFVEFLTLAKNAETVAEMIACARAALFKHNEVDISDRASRL